MSLSNSFETALLQHILQNANIANIGDATGLRGSSSAGSLYVALHTSDPGETGDQTTNEIAYTNYARVGIVRSGSGFAVSGNTGDNVAAITWPVSGSGGVTATHFSIGVASGGASMILWSGTIAPTIAINNGTQPEVAIGNLDLIFD